MCLEVFVATQRPLPVVEGPDFRVYTNVDPQHPALVHLGLPCIHYVVAHGGCGCGFGYRPFEPDSGLPEDVEADDRAENEARRRSVDGLRRLLATAIADGCAAEVYAVWSGEGALPPIGRRAIAPDHFGGDAFSFTERELLVVEPR